MEYEGVTLRDVYDARIILEVPMIEELARDRKRAVIAELEAIVERESQLDPGTEAVDQLTDFHAAIARLSGNRTLQIVSDMLHHIVAKANRSLQPTEGTRAEQAVRRSAKTHRMVLELIKQGEAQKAASCGAGICAKPRSSCSAVPRCRRWSTFSSESARLIQLFFERARNAATRSWNSGVEKDVYSSASAYSRMPNAARDRCMFSATLLARSA